MSGDDIEIYVLSMFLYFYVVQKKIKLGFLAGVCYNFNFSIISFDNAALGITILSVLIAK
jgi:hypothetical protein